MLQTKTKNKKEFVSIISKYSTEIMKNKKLMNEIATHLSNKHGIGLGRLSYFFNNTERLLEAEMPEVALIAEQISIKLEEAQELDLKNWFTPIEIKRFRQFVRDNKSDSDIISLPLVFENAVYLGRGVYQVAIDYSIIARMYKYGLLRYNENIQREGRLRKVNGEYKSEIKVYHKNVKEIKKEVLDGILDFTALAYNCAVDTTDDESGYELLFDPTNNTLTVTKGTIIDILDGTHRTMGIYEAYQEAFKEGSSIEGKITVFFSNYTEERAKKYQVSLAKATPFNKARAKEFENLSFSDELVSRLKDDGMLKQRISYNNKPIREAGQLTSSEILTKAFDKHWKPERRKDISNIVREFNIYLKVLFENYEDYIKDENDLLFSKMFFAGHVILARRMYEQGINYNNLYEILEGFDFNINNPLWRKLNITTEDNKIKFNRSTIKAIEDYFNEIEVR